MKRLGNISNGNLLVGAVEPEDFFDLFLLVGCVFVIHFLNRIPDPVSSVLKANEKLILTKHQRQSAIPWAGFFGRFGSELSRLRLSACPDLC